MKGSQAVLCLFFLLDRTHTGYVEGPSGRAPLFMGLAPPLTPPPTIRNHSRSWDVSQPPDWDARRRPSNSKPRHAPLVQNLSPALPPFRCQSGSLSLPKFNNHPTLRGSRKAIDGRKRKPHG